MPVLPRSEGHVPKFPQGMGLRAGGRAVLEKSFFLLRTALKDSSWGPPTVNRQPPPTAANRQPLFNNASVVLCLAHVLTLKQRAPA